VSAALRNYLSDNPSDLGNFMIADTKKRMAAAERQQESEDG
jgi:hypothetical protein